MEALAAVGLVMLVIAVGIYLDHRKDRKHFADVNAPSSPSQFGPGSGDVGPVDKV